jgi:hypothetical protein
MCDYRRGLDWRLDLLLTYTLTARDHTVQITDTQTSVLSLLVCSSRFLATDFNIEIVTVSLNNTLQTSHISLLFIVALSHLTLFFTASPVQTCLTIILSFACNISARAT